MSKIRLLVVDDSVVIRRLLTDLLNGDPDIEVVGTAASGRIALSKLAHLNPDVVTLDVEMPDMDGVATLRELRKTHPQLPVIMFSTLTERGAAVTFDALAAGASDYVAKPANVGSVSAGIQTVKQQLVPKVKALCKRVDDPGKLPTAETTPSRRILRPRSGVPSRVDVVAIGASTGGPQALASVLAPLPASFPAPIVIVQHMPPVFTAHLADRLNKECKIEVREAKHGDRVYPGLALIAPGDFHLEVERRGIHVSARLAQGPAENSCRPAVDVLFRSVASVYGCNCLAAVLTGMGQDGTRGAERIVEAGGSVIAQDEATSTVWGMPRAVTEAGWADRTFPIESIAEHLNERIAKSRRGATVS